jgi:hypothetical protein
LNTTSPVYPFEARFNVFKVGWVRRVVGIGPVRLLDAAFIFARVGRVSNRSVREVRAFPDISLGVSIVMMTKEGTYSLSKASRENNSLPSGPESPRLETSTPITRSNSSQVTPVQEQHAPAFEETALPDQSDAGVQVSPFIEV